MQEAGQNKIKTGSSGKLYAFDVHPCLVGSYVYKTSDYNTLYKVDSVGKLISISNMNGIRRPIDKFYNGQDASGITLIDLSNEVLFYYLPDGSLINSVEVRPFISK